MRKVAVLLVLVAVGSYRIPAADSPTALNKYLQPAVITRLDWLLLKAEVESFADTRWDDHNLIEQVSLYAVNKQALVGMVFVVNNKRYIDLSEDITRKVFTETAIAACNILKITIPEVENCANVNARFTTSGVGGGVVAEYSKGKMTFTK
jgi:hypothetical protein